MPGAEEDAVVGAVSALWVGHLGAVFVPGDKGLSVDAGNLKVGQLLCRLHGLEVLESLEEQGALVFVDGIGRVAEVV